MGKLTDQKVTLINLNIETLKTIEVLSIHIKHSETFLLIKKKFSNTSSHKQIKTPEVIDKIKLIKSKLTMISLAI